MEPHRLGEENIVVRVDHVTLACTKMQSQTANACLQKMPLSKLLGALPVIQTRKFSTLLFSSKQVSQKIMYSKPVLSPKYFAFYPLLCELQWRGP